MARGRRKGNPLLARIILISVAVHIVVLPILAYFGAFKKFQRGANQPIIMVLPPPSHEKQQEVKKQQKAARKVAAKAAAGHRSQSARSNAPQPRVVAAKAGPAGAGDSGPVVNPNGNGNIKPGTLPPGPTANKGTGAGTGTGVSPTPAPPAPKTAVTPEPVAKPAPPPPPPVKPHVPVITEVATTYNPSPVIPDDLRSQALDANVSAQFMVGPDGEPGNIKIVQSSGNDELDQIALEAARKWRFKPATRDGQPVESRVILHIEFQVQ